jgi:hypothetical protein
MTPLNDPAEKKKAKLPRHPRCRLSLLAPIHRRFGLSVTKSADNKYSGKIQQSFPES